MEYTNDFSQLIIKKKSSHVFHQSKKIISIWNTKKIFQKYIYAKIKKTDVNKQVTENIALSTSLKHMHSDMTYFCKP